MLQVGVSWSEQTDAFLAGKEAAGKALASLGAKPGFALAFCTVGYDEARFLAGIGEAVGPVTLMGATSFTGVLTPAGFLHAEQGAGAVMLLASAEMAFGVGAAEIGDDPESAGETAAREAVTQAKKSPSGPVSAFLLVAPPGAEERLIRGVERVVGRAPMIGGSAADNSLEGHWKEFANGRVLVNSAVVGLVYSKLPVAVGYTGHFTPTDRRGVITTVRDRRTLVKIDGRKALEVYAEWRAMKPEELLGGNLLIATIQHPLGIRDVSGDLWWIRHPMRGNEDGSMAIGSDLAEGTVVTMMAATLEEMTAGAGEVVRLARANLGGELGAVVMAHCGGRVLGLGPERMQDVVAEIKAALGNVPFIGYCTFGEQGYARWTANGAGGLMLSALALGK